MLVPLVAMAAGLVTHQAFKFLLLGNAPIAVQAIAPLLLVGLLAPKKLTSTSGRSWGSWGSC